MDGSVDPTKERFGRFKDLPVDRPIHMLNLIKLRAQAAYPDGRKTSGREAYRAYARESGPVFTRLGGVQVWIGRPELTLIGPEAESWKAIAGAPRSIQGRDWLVMTRPIIPVHQRRLKRSALNTESVDVFCVRGRDVGF